MKRFPVVNRELCQKVYGTFFCNTLDIFSLLDGQIAEDGEYDEPSKETGETVDHWRHYGVPVTVVMKWIVTGQR